MPTAAGQAVGTARRCVPSTQQAERRVEARGVSEFKIFEEQKYSSDVFEEQGGFCVAGTRGIGIPRAVLSS